MCGARGRRSGDGKPLVYTLYRAGHKEPVRVTITPTRDIPGPLYFILASVGLFTLLVGGAIRLRRPGDPATLHFLWLAVAFFGAFTFSHTGLFDRLDWTFYWADAVAMLALPPLFLHFTLVFPDRPNRWRNSAPGRVVEAAAYLPAVGLGLVRVAALKSERVGRCDVRETIVRRARQGGLRLSRALSDRWARCRWWALFYQVCTITARRQLRWIVWGTALGGVPFAVLYALPSLARVRPRVLMQLSAIPLGLIPLAYASAIAATGCSTSRSF